MNDTVNPEPEDNAQDAPSQHASSQQKRQIKSFVLRAGRMTSGQQRGWNECWSDWGLSLEDGVDGFQHAFSTEAPLVLEVGYGMGHSLVTMAD